MIKHFIRFPSLLLTLIIGVVSSSAAFGSVTITIQNNDLPGVGFNDPTPVAPVGGNPGTTLGDQRLNAFQLAANIWGASLNSGPSIVVNATWGALSCEATSGVLGSAGAASRIRNHPALPFSNTWYGMALANALAGTDLNAATVEINARFNLSIGSPGCLETRFWYLGFDNNHTTGIDLVTVVMHELAHGLGFQTFTSGSTGEQSSGFPTIYDRFLRDNTTSKLWINMTDVERQASAINNGNLVWAGTQVTADLSNIPGGIGVSRLRINSPASIAGGYDVGTAQFGPPLSTGGLNNNVAQANPIDGCSPLAGNVAGQIAFIDRGNCNFTVKVKNAQNAGATGVIIGNVSTSVDPGIPPTMGGTDPTITIPSVSLSLANADAIRAQLGSGVNATILLEALVSARLYAPTSFTSGSSVSHFDSAGFPNLLMEPNISNDLTHSVSPPQDLTLSLLRDIGWSVAAEWQPTVLSANQVELKSWTFEGRTYAYVKLTFPDAGYRVANWGTPVGTGNDFSADALVERFNGVSAQVITTTAQIYDLGALSAGNYTFTFKNSGTNVKTLNFTVGGAVVPNPIDAAREFVRWQYKDFLRREPDGPGWDHWTGEITECTTDPTKRQPGETEAQCIERKRANTSAAFFLSPEFQNTGYFVLRVYRGSLGRMPHFGGSNPPDVRDEFTRDAATVGAGIVVNDHLDPAVINANKQAFVNQFVTRAEFMAAYPASMTNQLYVDTLFTKTGVTPTSGERQALIDELNANAPNARASVLFKVVDGTTTITDGHLVFNTTYGHAFYDNLFNAAFVQMEYFGYLLRDPDDGGYSFWLGKLNQFGNWVDAQMVLAFIKSPEYRSRFGQP